MVLYDSNSTNTIVPAARVLPGYRTAYSAVDSTHPPSSTVFITIVRMADGQEPTPNQCTSFLNHRSNKTSLQTLSSIARYSDHDTSWFQRVSAYCVVYTYSLPVYIVYRVYINKYHIYICECMVEFCSSAPCFSTIAKVVDLSLYSSRSSSIDVQRICRLH